MDRKVVVSAILSFVIAFGGSMMTLFLNAGEFGEIKGTAVAFGFTAALVSVCKDVLSSLRGPQQ